jgi:hypothetical protein
VYVDKHSTYKSSRKLTVEEQLQGLKEPKSQFERALEELVVEVIHAHSPQAKGRIERLFGTFQDRLIKEMRLAGIRTKGQANRFLARYLPGYNRRFRVSPKQSADLHRQIPRGVDLDSILSVREKRTVRRDFTVAYDRELYQIEEPPAGVSMKAVVVEQRLDGSIHIIYNGRELKYKKIHTRPPRPKERKSPGRKKRYIPPPDHPWRKFQINPLTHQQREKQPLLTTTE